MSRTRTLRHVRRAARAWVALCLAAVIHSDAAARQGLTSVSGVVEDPRGALLPGVLVTLTSSAGARRSATTLSDGTFRFDSLPQGDYDLDISRRGFAETRVDLTLTAGHHLLRPVILRVSAVDEYIRISMTRPRSAATDRSRGAPLPQRREECTQPIGCVQPPVKLVDATPRYPDPARVDGIEGLVIVEVTINEQGSIEEIKPQVTPDRDLVEATVAAVRQWRFSPALLNGVPIESVLNVTADFVANDR